MSSEKLITFFTPIRFWESALPNKLIVWSAPNVTLANSSLDVVLHDRMNTVQAEICRAWYWATCTAIMNYLHSPAVQKSLLTIGFCILYFAVYLIVFFQFTREDGLLAVHFLGPQLNLDQLLTLGCEDGMNIGSKLTICSSWILFLIFISGFIV